MDNTRGSKRKLPGLKSDENLPGTVTNTSGERPRKQKNNKGRGRGGKLDRIMSLPVEVFCEIATHLSPRDLIRMSRSGDVLQDFFMSKSSTTIWRAAEQAYGLPECPSDLDSPQYASFVFDTFCTLCGERRAFKHIVLFRVRLCRDCSSASIKFGWQLPSIGRIGQRTSEERNDIYSLVPAAYKPGRPAYRHYVRLNHASSKYSYSFGEQSICSIFYAPAFEVALEQYLSLPSDSARKEFASERREITRRIKLESGALEAWLAERRYSQVRTNSDIKTNRRKDIYERLKQLGYSEDDFKGNNDEEGWKWKGLIAQSRELTERAWNSIRPQLEETIRLRWKKAQPALIETRRNELLKLAREFMSSDAGKDCVVAAGDLMELPLALQVINDVNPRVSFSKTVCDSLKTQMLELSRTWLTRLEEKCAQMITDGQRRSGSQAVETISSETDEPKHLDNAAICQLATSFFATRPSPSHYGLQLRTFDELLEGIRGECEDTTSGCRTPSEWKFESRVYPAPASLINAVYKAIGVTATTHAEMAAKGSSFVCLCCGLYLRKPMTWVKLVQHFYMKGQEFAQSEGSRSSSITIVSANNHDENRKGRLAAYQAESSNTKAILDLDRRGWMKPCRCELNSFGYPSLEGCEECYSRGAILAHWVATHERVEHPNQSQSDDSA